MASVDIGRSCLVWRSAGTDMAAQFDLTSCVYVAQVRGTQHDRLTYCLQQKAIQSVLIAHKMLMLVRVSVPLLTACHRAGSQDAGFGRQVCIYFLLLLNIIIRVTAWDSEFYVNCI